MTSDFKPRYLRNDYKSGKVTTGWKTYEMLTFHLYRWNQLKVIPMACTARARRAPCPQNTSTTFCTPSEMTAHC